MSTSRSIALALSDFVFPDSINILLIELIAELVSKQLNVIFTNACLRTSSNVNAFELNVAPSYRKLPRYFNI